jgi:hypothetical protein
MKATAISTAEATIAASNGNDPKAIAYGPCAERVAHPSLLQDVHRLFGLARLKRRLSRLQASECRTTRFDSAEPYRVHSGSRRQDSRRKGFTEAGYARLLDAAHQHLGGTLMVV